MAQRRYWWALTIGIVALVIILAAGVLLQNASAIGLGGVAMLVLLVILRVVPDLADRRIGWTLRAERRAIRGAEAEEEVGRLLAELGEDYLVLNDVSSPYGNIDHVVFGKRSGPFLIETKSHRGRIEFDGDRLLINLKPPEKDFFAQSLRNTYWLRDELAKIIGLNPWVTPILVFTKAFVPRAKPIRRVHVVNKKYLLQTIRADQEGLGLAARLWNSKDKVMEVLRRSTS
jgi:hypothetical protein